MLCSLETFFSFFFGKEKGMYSIGLLYIRDMLE